MSISKMISVNDELQEFKKNLTQKGFVIKKIEKVGNGNMAAFKIIYQKPHQDDMLEDFFWRHDLDNFKTKLLNSI